MQDVEERHREPLSPRALLRRLRDWTRQELSVPGEADLEIDDVPPVDDPAFTPRRPPEMRIQVRRGDGDGEPAALPDLSGLPVEATVHSTPPHRDQAPTVPPRHHGTDEPPPASDPLPANGRAGANGAGANGRRHPDGADLLAERVARLEAGMRLLAETLELAHADVAEAVRGLQAAVRGAASPSAAREAPIRPATQEDLTGLARQEDLAGLATQEDLTQLPTREDLAGLPTREDLAGLVTRDDLAGLATRLDVERTVSAAVEPLARALARLTEAVNALPSAFDAAIERASDRLGDRIDTVRVDVEESLIALLPRRENGHARQPSAWAPGR